MENYDHKKIEAKWQKLWQESSIYHTDFDNEKKPFYNLMMFPYPSAEGLHIGSVYTFSGVDTFGRYQKMKGQEVFEPIGLDGFGIHSENFAIKIGEHIRDVSKRTEKHFYDQMKATGNMYDWDRTVETYKPDYYKWTQWLFLQLYKKGLAYRKNAKVNWCPTCKTVLSDEQVIDGKCERTGDEVIKKDMEQWFFKITKYTKRLLDNLDWIKWDEEVKLGQKNWIGKSEGAIVKFEIQNSKSKGEVLEVYTTAHDTIFGATFMVIAPEHELLDNMKESITNWNEVEEYRKSIQNKSELERTDLNKDKTGLKVEGLVVINPANNKEIPLFVADYVLVNYGTGAIMAVPGHDERDFEFANKYNLEITYVIKDSAEFLSYQDIKVAPEKYIVANSGKYDGMNFKEARKQILDDLNADGVARPKTNYKLRDWCVSRQRYWGPPIPMLHRESSKSKIQNSTLREAQGKVLIVHGFDSKGTDNWFPWLKETLAQDEIEAMNPDFPNAASPKLDEWIKTIEEQNLSENDTIVGHSMGCFAAMRYAEDHKVGKLIMVAPTNTAQEGYWDNQKKLFPDFPVDALRKDFYNKEIDNAKVKVNVEKIIFIFSTNDPYITSEVQEQYAREFPDAEFVYVSNRQHFGKANHTKQLYEILDFIDNTTSEWLPVPEDKLPVELPDIPKFEDILPDGSGKGPLEKQESFINTELNGVKYRRETDVSDPFVDSCWYFLRYPFTDLQDKPFEFVERAMIGSSEEIDARFIDSFINIYAQLESAGLWPVVTGSIALTGLNGKAFKQINDMDFVFISEENAKKAQEIIESLGGKFVEKDEDTITMKINEFTIDLNFKGYEDIYLGYKVSVFNQRIRILDPKIMKEDYTKFTKDFDQKLEIIDFWEKQKINKWFPITYYIGGKEHTVLHLLYARFITMVLNDMGYIDFEEPFERFYGHGLITKDGAKMSKSKGNVINPDEYFERFGADGVRMYLRFLGPFEQGGDWRDTGMIGMTRFVGRVWEIYQRFVSRAIDFGQGVDNISKLHQTIKGVGEDIDKLRFNTAIAKLMELINWYKDNEKIFDKEQTEELLRAFSLMIAPISPHLAEEFWMLLNKYRDEKWEWSKENSVHSQLWPKYDPAKLVSDVVVIAVQFNGKSRGTIEVNKEIKQDEVVEIVKNDEKLSKYITGEFKKVIFVPGRIINIIL